MKTLVKTAIVLVGAGAFCWALSAAASADVVTPRSAYQPASTNLLSSAPAAREMPSRVKTESVKVAAAGAESKPEPTPASEQVVRPARVPTAHENARPESPSVAYRLAHPFGVGLDHLTASLGRAVGACEVGFGTGTGGPVLVLAVLGMAIPFIRRRVIGTRWTADEDVPEFLYAWEQTPPG